VGSLGPKGIHSSPPSGAGQENTGANVGAGQGNVFRDKTGVVLNFKTLLQGSNITITDNADDITIAATGGAGEVNTASNSGTGVGLAQAKNVFDLPFRSIVNSATISWVENTDDVVASIVALSITDAFINAAANIAKTKISTTGTWPVADIPSLPATIITSLRFAIARLPIGTAFQRIRTNSGATDPEYFTEKGAIVFVIGDGTAVITTGIKVFVRLPADLEIARWTVLSKDATSSIVVDINRYTSLANYDAGTKASIAGSDLPTLVADKGNDSVALTGWTTALNALDILEAEVDSITTATRVTVILEYNKRG